MYPPIWQVAALHMAAAARLQALARGVIARMRRRVAACDFRHSLVVEVHALVLPDELARPESVHTASVALELVRPAAHAL